MNHVEVTSHRVVSVRHRGNESLDTVLVFLDKLWHRLDVLLFGNYILDAPRLKMGKQDE